MNTSTLLLSGVSGVLAIALVWQSRSAATDSDRAAGEIGKFSNDWKQAVFKLDEQSRLAYTLQTQLKLVQEEHLTATNELPKVRAAFSLLQSNHLSAVERAQGVSNRLQWEVLELQEEKVDTQQRLQQLQSRLQDLDQHLARATSQLAQSTRQVDTLSNAWRKAELGWQQAEGRLRDPVVLAAQMAQAQAEAKSRTRHGDERGSGPVRIELLPDGSVKQTP